MRAKIIASILLCAVFLTGCGGLGGGSQATPQPASPEQISRDLVNQLNSYLVSMDPIGYVIDAKFQVVDARYATGNENKLVGLEVYFDCQSQVNTCSKERAAAVFFQALKAKQGSLGTALPDTLKDFTVYTFNQRNRSGTIKVKWKDVSDYLKDVIGGAQLATRLEITNP